MDEHIWTPKTQDVPLKATRDELFLGISGGEWGPVGLSPFRRETLAEFLRLADRVRDLEAVVQERGGGAPAPAEIDRSAFEALDPGARFDAFREAAGWALQARAWEARVRELEQLVQAADRSDELEEVIATLEAKLVLVEKAWAGRLTDTEANLCRVTAERDRLAGRETSLEAENAALREAARSQAEVVSESLSPGGKVGVNFNALAGVAHRLQWASEGDFAWMKKT